MDGLIVDAWRVISHPRTLAEAAVIIVAIGIAMLLARVLRSRAGDADSMHGGGFRRLAMPLIAIGLLTLARFVAHHYGWPVRFLGIAVQLLIAMAVIRMVVFALRHASRAPWVASFERSIALLIWAGVALDIIGVLPELIAWLEGFSLPLGKGKVTLWAVLQGVVMVIGTILTALWIGGLVETRLMAAPAMDTSLKVVLSRVVNALLLVVAVLMGMSIAGLDITTLSVFGGALGVGLGFGMQKIASNYVSGFIILLDRSIQIGDLIQVGEQRGEVRQITTRYTVLRAPSGIHYIMPNETLVASVVQNDSFADRRVRVTLRVQVGYRSDVERALVVLEEIARAYPRVVSDPPVRASLVAFEDSGIALELGVWIADPENGQLEVRSDLNRAILKRFREEGIEIPFPQREVRLIGGVDEAGGASAPTV